MLSKIMGRATLEECRKKWFLEFYIFFCHSVASYLMLLKMVKESLTKNPLSVPTSAPPPQLRHTLPCCGQRPFLFFKPQLRSSSKWTILRSQLPFSLRDIAGWYPWRAQSTEIYFHNFLCGALSIIIDIIDFIAFKDQNTQSVKFIEN